MRIDPLASKTSFRFLFVLNSLLRLISSLGWFKAHNEEEETIIINTFIRLRLVLCNGNKVKQPTNDRQKVYAKNRNERILKSKQQQPRRRSRMRKRSLCLSVCLHTRFTTRFRNIKCRHRLTHFTRTFSLTVLFCCCWCDSTTNDLRIVPISWFRFCANRLLFSFRVSMRVRVCVAFTMPSNVIALFHRSFESPEKPEQWHLHRWIHRLIINDSSREHSMKNNKKICGKSICDTSNVKGFRFDSNRLDIHRTASLGNETTLYDCAHPFLFDRSSLFGRVHSTTEFSISVRCESSWSWRQSARLCVRLNGKIEWSISFRPVVSRKNARFLFAYFVEQWKFMDSEKRNSSWAEVLPLIEQEFCSRIFFGRFFRILLYVEFLFEVSATLLLPNMEQFTSQNRSNNDSELEYFFCFFFHMISSWVLCHSNRFTTICMI